MDLEEVGRKYDWAAPRYDRFSDIVLGKLLRAERYRARAVELLSDIRGATVLDIGCGTGRSFPMLLQRVGPQGRVLGLDYSAGMLQQARRLVDTHGWRNVELVQCDALNLDRVVEPVDAVISVWCYGIVSDLTCALERAVDVVAPGGPVSIMAFTRARPDRQPLRSFYPLYRSVLTYCGAASEDDLDDDKLREKWDKGRALLDARLDALHEERHVHGTLTIFSGRRRAEDPAALRQRTRRLRSAQGPDSAGPAA